MDDAQKIGNFPVDAHKAEESTSFSERNPDLALMIRDALAISNAFVLDLNGSKYSPQAGDVVASAFESGATSVLIKNAYVK